MSWRLARSLVTLSKEIRTPYTTIWTIGDISHASLAGAVGRP